mmetsp:Transcript_1755/g.3091  ORF Transcript_1755/g.3091 Transcript_1755/m.3091 type:complete len:100 (-) Transcript_1755:919-1218(-)
MRVAQSRQHKEGAGQFSSNVARPSHHQPNQGGLVQTLSHPGEGDITTCLNLTTSVSNQDLLIYSSQRGSIFLHDTRCRAPVLTNKDCLGMQRGMVTCSA